MERNEEGNIMTRKDSKGGQWGSKRVYDKATGKSKIVRFRIKPKINWGVDKRFPVGRGVRLEARHSKDIFTINEKEILKKQAKTEAKYGLRKGFGLFRSIAKNEPPATQIVKVKGVNVQITTPFMLVGIKTIPRSRQKNVNPERRLPFRRKFRTIKDKRTGKRVIPKTPKMYSAEQQRKRRLRAVGIFS